MEDAAVVRPENGPPFVLTVDFITPIVDEPESFGAIAAANALSDVYAMGGLPQGIRALDTNHRFSEISIIEHITNE